MTHVTRHSARTARLFGFILILLVCAWDVDAMRPHIAAHSWTTLAFVSLFLTAHLSDYLTVGRLVHRPLTFPNANGIALAPVAHGETKRPAQPTTRKAIQTAELYTFSIVTTTAARASGASYPLTQQHITVQRQSRVPYSGEARVG
jgi:hypothetical protein